MKKYIYIALIIVVVVGAVAWVGNYEQSLNTDYEPPEMDELTETEYDVVVVGGEPEGVAAAVSAARNGAETLLIEKRDGLGGLMTYGMLNYIDMVNGIGGESAIGGIFAEWHEIVGGEIAFDIERGKDAFMHLVLSEPNLTLTLETDVQDAMVGGDQTVTGAVVLRDDETFEVQGQRFIDATQDADFAVKAGAPYFKGGGDINMPDRNMAVTLMIHLEGVDWSGVKRAAQEEVFGPGTVTDNVAWGFSELHYDYQPVEENTRLRGLNLVRVKDVDGSEDFYINALQIFDVDGTDPEENAAAIEKGKRETEHVVEYLRENFPGFENAEIASYPSELYVRETRHVISEYMLPMSDVWTHRDHWDSIAYGGYPVDVQATSVDDYGYVLSSPNQYAIPFRSTVPLEVENLIVVSRSAGYSSLAAGSARIIPSGMAVGEAGGAAAQLSLERDMTFRELSHSESDIEDLREGLLAQGAKVEHFSIDYPYKGEWYDEAVQFLMDYGLVVAGYDNDLQVDEALNRQHFINLILNGLKRINEDAYNQYIAAVKAPSAADESFGEGTFTRDGLAEYLLDVFIEGESFGEPWNQLLEFGLIDGDIYEMIPNDAELDRKHGYYIAAHVLQQYVE
ncbi:FAD-dependent oxidoreductase [Tenuibacillus multivorans]|uniref:FAD dependent oxidoreductase n=1 Tax=Tenuibacillus multivorans TaxID=237069 RepID=A0A1G9X7F7_9BACI|nr:FAD-dependent oxidoreductase [Tenuibacillus multivorans]GEL78653.1 hypothetical protein TMU01_28880 [Tenuibacillus multivorans]SDM92263.1 FAD dependent oxidoreductase [Tenuibacillus multivorans]